MELVTPQISLGGTDTVLGGGGRGCDSEYFGPLVRDFANYSWANVANLMASCFHLAQLESYISRCQILMSLYLHISLSTLSLIYRFS